MEECKLDGFLFRIRSLQRLCGAADGLPCALLFVAGADGRYNKGSASILKYLFFGAVGKDLMENSLDAEYECLDNVVLLIQQSSVSILWSQEIKEKLGFLMTACPMLVEYITSAAEEEDVDEAQARICCNFTRMMLESVVDGSGVGVTVPVGYADAQEIENWPLLQAFALDSVYCPTGFFTARYAVVDITEQLDVLFKAVDTFTLTNAIDTLHHNILPHAEQVEGLLDTLWGGDMMGMEDTSISTTTAEDIIGPLEMLFEFGELNACFGVDPALKPILLLGADTGSIGNRARASDWSKKCLSSKHLHCILEACEPSSGMRWCRTFLLQQSKESSASSSTLFNEASLLKFASVKRIESLYTKLWLSLRMAVRLAFSEHQDILAAASAIQDTLDQVMKGKQTLTVHGLSDGLSQCNLIAKEQLEVHMDCMNAFGQIVTIDDVDDMEGVCFAYIRVAIHGISVPVAAASSKSMQLGSIAVGDTFLFSACTSSRRMHEIKGTAWYKAQQTGGKSLKGLSPVDCRTKFKAKDDFLPFGDCFCLTGNVIPYHRSFFGEINSGKNPAFNVSPVHSPHFLLSSLRKPHILSVLELGKRMDAGVGSRSLVTLPMLTDHPVAGVYNKGSFEAYESGFVLQKLDQNCMPTVVSFAAHVESAWTVDVSECVAQAIAFLKEPHQRVGCSRLQQKIFDTWSQLSEDVDEIAPSPSAPYAPPAGIVIIFRLKTEYTDEELELGIESSATHNAVEQDEKKLVHHILQGNPLTRLLPSYDTDTEAHHLAVYIPSSTSESTGMFSVFNQWKQSIKRLGIQDHKGADVAIPENILRSFILATDRWSYQQGRTSAEANMNSALLDPSSLKDQMTSSGAKTAVADMTTLMAWEFASVNPGLGYHSMRSHHLVAESSRLSATAREEEGAEPAMNPRAGNVKPSALVVFGHAGSGVTMVTAQLKERLMAMMSSDGLRRTATTSHANTMVISVLDLSLINESTSLDELIKQNTDCSTTASLHIITVLVNAHNFVDLGHVEKKLSFMNNICMSMSVVSATSVFADRSPIGRYGAGICDVTGLGLGYESWQAMGYELCKVEALDMVVVVSDNTHAYNALQTRVSQESCNLSLVDSIVRLTTVNLRLDDTSLEQIYTTCVVGSSSGVEIEGKEHMRNAARICRAVGSWGIQEELHQQDVRCQRESVAHTTLCRTLQSCHVSFPHFRSSSDGCVWDMNILSNLMKRLFPLAAMTNTIDVHSWNKTVVGSKGMKRAVELATTKVMTARYRTESMAAFQAEANKLTPEVLGHIQQGMFCLYGTVKVQEMSGNSVYAMIEACAGAIIVRPSEVPGNTVTFQGSLHAADVVSLKHLLELCSCGAPRTLTTIGRHDVNASDLMDIQRKYAQEFIQLPTGCWFDGQFYIDVRGNRSVIRPDVEQMVDRYVEDANRNVEKYNKMLLTSLANM